MKAWHVLLPLGVLGAAGLVYAAHRAPSPTAKPAAKPAAGAGPAPKPPVATAPPAPASAPKAAPPVSSKGGGRATVLPPLPPGFNAPPGASVTKGLEELLGGKDTPSTKILQDEGPGANVPPVKVTEDSNGQPMTVITERTETPGIFDSLFPSDSPPLPKEGQA